MGGMNVERIWVLVLLGILVSVWGQAEVLERNWWWEVRIEVSVRGEYSRVGDEGEVTGQYSFVLASKSGMERDNGDYLLYPGESELVSLDWVEIEGADKGSKVKNVEHLVKPVLQVNYVLRESGRASFDFEILSRRHLLLPRSYENRTIHPKDHYNRDIREGDNRAQVEDKLLYERDLASTAVRWRWERAEAAGRHEHTVECRSSVIRRLKR